MLKTLLPFEPFNKKCPKAVKRIWEFLLKTLTKAADLDLIPRSAGLSKSKAQENPKP